MPMRIPGQTPPRVMQRSRRRALTTGNAQNDYNYSQQAIFRHEFLQTHHTGVLNSGDYFTINMLKFKRTFDATTPDDPPTPTSSNNYETADVFNGSRIIDYIKKIQVTSNKGTATSNTRQAYYLDIYQIVLSFFDGKIWEDYSDDLDNETPINFVDAATFNTAGEVDFKTTHVPLLANQIKRSKFIQRYMKLIGRIEIDSGKTMTININRVPPKCRRANTGMFWGLLFHNDAIMNAGTSWIGDVTSETSFSEIPAENRLPFLY